MEAVGLTAVSEWPDQACRSDVAEVARDRAFVGAEVGEALDERLGHALGEQVPHPFGRRHGEDVEARVVLVEDPERGEQGEGG